MIERRSSPGPGRRSGRGRTRRTLRAEPRSRGPSSEIARPVHRRRVRAFDDLESHRRLIPRLAVVVDRDLLARRDVPERREQLGPPGQVHVAGVGPVRVVVQRAVAQGQRQLAVTPFEDIERLSVGWRAICEEISVRR